MGVRFEEVYQRQKHAVYGYLSYMTKDEDTAEPEAAVAAPVSTAAAVTEDLTDDYELAAVIAAAIAASEGAASTDGFVVRSIRRANTSKWKANY